MVIGRQWKALTQVPFTAPFGSIDPYRVCLLNKGIPLFTESIVEQGVLLVANMARRAFLIIEQKFLREEHACFRCTVLLGRMNQKTHISDS